MFWENTSGMNCGNVDCIFATEDGIEVKECGILIYVHTQHSSGVLDSFSCVCVCVCLSVCTRTSVYMYARLYRDSVWL